MQALPPNSTLLCKPLPCPPRLLRPPSALPCVSTFYSRAICRSTCRPLSPRPDKRFIFFWGPPHGIHSFGQLARRRVFRYYGRAYNLPWGRLCAQPYRFTPWPDGACKAIA